ncbi:hypothetical protein P9068_06770 [Gallibacterium anatis]
MPIQLISLASLGFDLKVDFILLRLRLALMLWFRPKGDLLFFACAKQSRQKKHTLNACFSSFRSDFPGGKKTDFSSKLEKLTLFLPENLPCIRASVKGNPLVLLSKFVIGNKLKARFHN